MHCEQEKYKPLGWQSKTFLNKHLHLIDDNLQEITNLAKKYAFFQNTLVCSCSWGQMNIKKLFLWILYGLFTTCTSEFKPTVQAYGVLEKFHQEL